MKLKSLLNVGLLIVAATWFTGCATTAQKSMALGPNEARVTGHAATLMIGVTIIMAPADRASTADWKKELVVQAGANRLAMRFKSILDVGFMGAEAEAYNVAEVAFVAEAGHEYYAEMDGVTILNMGYKITDKATGKVVGAAKVNPKKE